MAQIIGTFRLGRDAELRYIPSGEAVANLALACNYGQKDSQGNRPTQWVDASLWGKRAEALVQYLVKGQQVYVVLNEPHIETYQGQNGQGHKLVARVMEIELVGGRPDGAQSQSQQRQAAPQRQTAPAAAPVGGGGSGGFDDMDDDIPFASPSMNYDMEPSLSRRMRRYGF